MSGAQDAHTASRPPLERRGNRGAPPEQWNDLIIGRGELWLHFTLATDYGMHELAVVDPSGTLVRVGSPA